MNPTVRYPAKLPSTIIIGGVVVMVLHGLNMLVELPYGPILFQIEFMLVTLPYGPILLDRLSLLSEVSM